MSRVSEFHVLTKHDTAKRPHAICVSCGEFLTHGEEIVGMPVGPLGVRWLDRQWHLPCFMRRFRGELIPRESRFNPVTTLIRDGR